MSPFVRIGESLINLRWVRAVEYADGRMNVYLSEDRATGPCHMRAPTVGAAFVRDTADFDAFYEGSRVRLMHQMYAMTGNFADAQECVQEAYARAWQRWSTVRTSDSPEAWLRTVAVNVSRTRAREFPILEDRGVPIRLSLPFYDVCSRRA